MRILDEDRPEPSSGSGAGKIVAILLLLVLIGAGVAYYVVQQGDKAEDVAAQPAPEAEPSPKAPASRPKREAAPAAGSLSVWASVEGATIFVDDENVGDAPYENSVLATGTYRVRIEKDGYRTFTENVRVRGGAHAAVEATLALLPASVRVDSDVAGATVFLDRNYIGTTPVDIEEVEPGRHELRVSADGYDLHAETLVVTRGHRDIVVHFKNVTLDESVVVVHKHGFGSCEGTLVADVNGIRYETDHKDAFVIGFGQLERFEVDYIEKNMNLKVRGGRNYNFTEKSGNSDPLFVFHKNVQEFIDRQRASRGGR